MSISFTVQEFKDFFYREGFSYNPYSEYSSSNTYSLGDLVLDPVSYKVYKSISGDDNINHPLTNDIYWELQSIDVLNTYILDKDIERCIGKASLFIDGRLLSFYSSAEALLKEAMAYLSAHYMVTELAFMGHSISNIVATSVSAEGVSSSGVLVSSPDRENTGFLTQTKYGLKYMEIIKVSGVQSVMKLPY
jgi:hypothetical protein